MNVKMLRQKKFVSLILAICMLVSCFTVAGFSASAQDVSYNSSSANAAAAQKYGLADNVQDGVIFHAWNWSYNNIKNNLEAIAEQGFTTIQTSPPQVAKEGTAGKTSNGSWWVFYQPAGFSIDTNSDNALGTKTQLKSMIDEAHNYGLKVIVDVVANHLGNRSNAGDLCQRAYTYEPEIANNWLFHNNGGANDGSIEAVVKGAIGMPDLRTSDARVQNRVLAFLKECVDVGVDGFRFDAAKHIETPDDGYNGSQFWPTVLNGVDNYAKAKNKTLYHYGEILNTCGSGRSYNSYEKLMSYTDNTTGNNIRHSVEGKNAQGAASSHYNSGGNPKKLVLWAESHDTYANDERESTYCSDSNINKTWAMVASRSNATSLYFARPRNFNGGTRLGDADKTAWANKEVGEVNKFHNYFIGKSEYVSSSGSIAYNERGTEGAILVNVNGNSTSVNVKANKMANGTYIDQVSGNTFTVSGGQISGQIGSTGIAVVYNATTSPQNTISQSGGSFTTDSLQLDLGLVNATSGTYQIDNSSVKTYTGNTKITIGSGLPYGSKITVKLTATEGGKTESSSYTFTKRDPSEVTTIYFDNSSYNWQNVNCYIYKNEGELVNAKWPGEQMSKDSNNPNYYKYELSDNLSNSQVIFTESESSNNRYPADTLPGLEINGSSMIFKANNVWEEYTEEVPTTPTDPTKPTDPTNPTDPKPVTKVLLGDVNGDGIINVKDATIVQLNLVDVFELDEKALFAGNVTGDGVLSVKDITCIQKHSADISIPELKIGEYVDYYGDSDEPTKPSDPVVTDPSTPEEEGNFIYFKNNSNWNNVHAYYWQTSSDGPIKWPGVQMTSVGNNIYKIEIPDDMDNVIFNDGNGDQTGNISIPSFNQIYDNGSWSTYK